MSTEEFFKNLVQGIYVNEDFTRKYGYVDFIIQAGKLRGEYDIQTVLPAEFEQENISTTPGVPLSNGRYLYYCRAKKETVLKLLSNEQFCSLFLADSWSALFEMDFPHWGEVFEIETERRIKDGSTEHWRGKAASVSKSDKIKGVFVPCVFAGDTLPDFDLSHWNVRNLFQSELVAAPAELEVALQTVSVELIKYLRKHPEKLYQLKPRQFEELVCEILAGFGWDVQLTGATRDGGYDIFAISKDISGARSSWLIECKKYSPANKVGIDVVRSLCGVKNDLKVSNAMIATTSFFSSEVKKVKTSRYDFHLVDYDGIVEWLNSSYKADSRTGILVRE
jgi:hypothetical protein